MNNQTIPNSESRSSNLTSGSIRPTSARPCSSRGTGFVSRCTPRTQTQNFMIGGHPGACSPHSNSKSFEKQKILADTLTNFVECLRSSSEMLAINDLQNAQHELKNCSKIMECGFDDLAKIIPQQSNESDFELMSMHDSISNCSKSAANLRPKTRLASIGSLKASTTVYDEMMCAAKIYQYRMKLIIDATNSKTEQKSGSNIINFFTKTNTSSNVEPNKSLDANISNEIACAFFHSRNYSQAIKIFKSNYEKVESKSSIASNKLLLKIGICAYNLKKFTQASTTFEFILNSINANYHHSKFGAQKNQLKIFMRSETSHYGFIGHEQVSLKYFLRY